MPPISYDGQSFSIDGRRTWLVSGAVHYARTPRGLWRRRIRAAKQAGLNCIETYVFWNLHEPRPGVFHFEDDLDLRQFVKLVGQEGMFCILRPGPYICAEWDFGGLPAWLHRIDEVKLRQASPPFMEACARYLGAVLDEVKDLQVTSLPDPKSPMPGGGGGPIIMMQAENEWFCHNPPAAEKYLREIVRYLRENGCDVPINICNNLWQRVDGAIDTWNADRNLISDLRQLRVVQPHAPRIVTEFWPGWYDTWAQPHDQSRTAAMDLYRLAAILAVGAQYNLYMFHGGTNFGFWGGRTIQSRDSFVTTSYDYDAPLLEAGGRGEKYRAVKLISTFASQFGHVFSHLQPASQHAASLPKEKGHGLSVIHQTGTQGSVVFLLKDEDDKRTEAEILLPDGQTLSVPIGEDRAAWLLLDASLGSETLTFTNLRPWAMVGKKLLVLFGPSGADGLVSINHAMLSVKVPEGAEPLIQHHEDLTLAVLNRQQVDAAYVVPDGIVVGAAGLNDQNQPVADPAWPTAFMINTAGQVTRVKPQGPRHPTAPKLQSWQQASLERYVSGKSEKFKAIDRPKSLEQMNADYGYGWYRLRFDNEPGTISKALAAESGDRLHVFNHGKFDGVFGLGPGAKTDPARLPLSSETVVLADNLGRYNFGWHMGEMKGLFGHIHGVKEVTLGKPKITAGTAPDPFVLSDFWPGLRVGEKHPSDSLVWSVRVPAGKPLILDVHALPLRVMVFFSGRPIGVYDPGYSAGFGRFILESRKPRAELRLALFEPYDGKTNPLKFMTLYQSTGAVTEKAEWAFAPWSPPEAKAFNKPGSHNGTGPCWYRTTFETPSADAPLWLEPVGMSKGQIYLNGHNVGRYFVATADGKRVLPQHRYYLPEPWLRTAKPNELMLFDEHGKNPRGCRLVYDPMGPYG